MSLEATLNQAKLLGEARKRIAKLETQRDKANKIIRDGTEHIADLEGQLVCRICHEKGECHCPEYVTNLEKREAVLKEALEKQDTQLAQVELSTDDSKTRNQLCNLRLERKAALEVE